MTLGKGLKVELADSAAVELADSMADELAVSTADSEVDDAAADEETYVAVEGLSGFFGEIEEDGPELLLPQGSAVPMPEPLLVKKAAAAPVSLHRSKCT